MESIEPARPGRELQLSLDLRLQFLAYRALKQAMEDHDAVGGTAVLVGVAVGGTGVLVGVAVGGTAETGTELVRVELADPTSTTAPKLSITKI